MIFMIKSMVHKPSIVSYEVVIVNANRLVRYDSQDLAEVSNLFLFSCGSPGTDDMISFFLEKGDVVLKIMSSKRGAKP